MTKPKPPPLPKANSATSWTVSDSDRVDWFIDELLMETEHNCGTNSEEMRRLKDLIVGHELRVLEPHASIRLVDWLSAILLAGNAQMQIEQGDFGPVEFFTTGIGQIALRRVELRKDKNAQAEVIRPLGGEDQWLPEVIKPKRFMSWNLSFPLESGGIIDCKIVSPIYDQVNSNQNATITADELSELLGPPSGPLVRLLRLTELKDQPRQVHLALADFLDQSVFRQNSRHRPTATLQTELANWNEFECGPMIQQLRSGTIRPGQGQLLADRLDHFRRDNKNEGRQRPPSFLLLPSDLAARQMKADYRKLFAEQKNAKKAKELLVDRWASRFVESTVLNIIENRGSRRSRKV